MTRHLYALFALLVLLGVFYAGTQAPPIDNWQGRALAQSGDFPFCWQFDSPTSGFAIPCPTQPEPTDTPVPTWTPTDTQTPVFTATPSPTLTPTPEPTVTPEPGLTCDLIAQFTIKKRTSPNTTAAQNGSWSAGDRSTFDSFSRDSTYLWGHHASGNWSAVARVSGELEWWVYTPVDGVLCEGVEGYPLDWPDPPPEPTPAFIVGLHITNGERQSLTDFYRAMNEAGYDSGAKPYAFTQYCLDALLSGNTCTMRWPPDCPEQIGGTDPEASARKYMDARNFAVSRLWTDSGNSEKLIIELTNECPNEPYDWWNRWLLEAVAYAERNNWPPLALAGLGPGYGNVVMFEAWKPALMANHARGGYLSTHNYAPVEYCGGDGSLSNGNIYCAFRHRLNYRIITEELGYDVRILITESSPTNGYQPVTGDTLRDIGKYTCMIQDDPGLYGIYYWNVGNFAPFADANLGPYLVPLASAIRFCGP